MRDESVLEVTRVVKLPRTANSHNFVEGTELGVALQIPEEKFDPSAVHNRLAAV